MKILEFASLSNAYQRGLSDGVELTCEKLIEIFKSIPTGDEVVNQITKLLEEFNNRGENGTWRNWKR